MTQTVQTLKFPEHVGIIMDGNGRWAKQHNKPRVYGHYKATNAVRSAIQFCVTHKIKVLTLYAFSTENWIRPAQEIDYLMELIPKFISNEVPQLMKHHIKLCWIGRRDRINPSIAKKIEEVETLTAKHEGLILNFAFDYGSRDEIATACRKISADVKTGKLDMEDINEKLMSTYMHTSGMPDVDLIIRTSGEKRISNFLLWQGAYSEYCFFDEYWPEFNETLFLKAITEFSARNRRKGGID